MAMTVAVTGPTGGIGRAVVEALGAAGHRVLAVGRPSERLEELCAGGKGVVAHHVDLGAGAPALVATEIWRNLDDERDIV